MPDTTSPHSYSDDRRVRLLGLVAVLVVFGVFGAWATLAPLSSAALAPGAVTVENYRKSVQHLEGGIVKSIAVHDNDLVTKGQVLLTMDDTQARTQLEVLRGQLYISLAREARLIAQRDGSARVVYSEVLRAAAKDSRVEEAMKVQNQTFSARRNAHEGEISLYSRQIGQLQAKLRGLRAQKQSRDQLVVSYGKEVQDFESLLKEGYTDAQKVREMQRNLAQSEGQQGELLATIASTELQISETELKILQLKKDLQREVAKELGEVQNDLFSLREKVQSLEDTVKRTVIVAPDAGRVLGLAVHTLGAVVPPGGKVLDIVPQNERLILEAQVSPNDIDRVKLGQTAEVRFSAFKSHNLPKIEGKLISVSADRLVEEGNRTNPQTYFLARVEVSAVGLAELARRHLVMVPGMPAEVMINTGERTLLQYFIRPLRDSVARGMKED